MLENGDFTPRETFLAPDSMSIVLHFFTYIHYSATGMGPQYKKTVSTLKKFVFYLKKVKHWQFLMFDASNHCLSIYIILFNNIIYFSIC